MPYIVTTHYPHRDEEEGGSAPDERTAVATLEEAREAVAQTINAARVPNLHPAVAQYDALPEAGGTVGPLPDGTVIEVRHAPISSPFADAGAWCEIYNRHHAS
jgi:hypothetical protein